MEFTVQAWQGSQAQKCVGAGTRHPIGPPSRVSDSRGEICSDEAPARSVRIDLSMSFLPR